MIYGSFSKLCKKTDMQNKYSDKMLRAWQRFVDASPAGDAQRNEIEPIVRSRYNPYTGRPVK